jgi:hypothetical protein
MYRISCALILFFMVQFPFLVGCRSWNNPVSIPFNQIPDIQIPDAYLSDDIDRAFQIQQAQPELAIRFTGPPDLIDEGWGEFPAIAATSFQLTAEIYGTRMQGFNGDLYISVDGMGQPCNCQNGLISANISVLTTGFHNIFIAAASMDIQAFNTLDFEVPESLPFMQVGIEIDSGNLYATLSKPFPRSQLSNMANWRLADFNAEIIGVEVLPGNRDVRLILSTPVSIYISPLNLPPGLDPTVHFQSSLGEITGSLFQFADVSFQDASHGI